MDRRRTTQLLRLGRNIMSTTVAMLTGHGVMSRHAERMGSHLTTSTVVADPLRKRRLFPTFFVIARLSLGVDMD